jgi:copper chaperone NosL
MRIVLFALAAALAACGGPPAPASLMAGVACSHCRMSVSDPRLAAQIASSADDPRFFDDIGCLAAYLREHPLPADALAYVADHADGAWVRADRAVYSRAESLSTPMGSHIVAHADEAARAADEAVRGAARLSFDEVLASAGHGGE